MTLGVIKEEEEERVAERLELTLSNPNSLSKAPVMEMKYHHRKVFLCT